MTGSSAQRIQRRRSKGWRMPEGAVYVGRPGRFGNPFDWMIFGHEGAVDFYRRWLAADLTPAEILSTGMDLPSPDYVEAMRQRILEGLEQLRGKDLACWCRPGLACHADVLLELANA